MNAKKANFLRRAQIEHIMRAVSGISGKTKFVLIDASIGKGSLFDETFGYHAHGIGPTTAMLPGGWRARAKEVTWPSLPGVTCICPEVDDIALSKVCAWREKDISWLKAARQAGMLDLASITARVADLEGREIPASAELCRRIDSLTPV